MLTQTQYTALNPHRHIWVHACAGTGKTFILIYRILRLLLEGVRPERIVALTFTQHAGKEMTQRLYSLLEEIMRSSYRCKTVLTMCLGGPAHPHQISYAQKLWSEILDTSLNIQTLHSFCQNILQTFSLEAGIIGNFKILDENQGVSLWNQQQEWVCSAAYPASVELQSALVRLATRYTLHQITSHLQFLWNRSKEVIFPTKHPKPSELSPPALLCPRVLAQLTEYLGEEYSVSHLKGLELSWDRPEYRAFFLTQKGTPRKKLLSVKVPEHLKQWLEFAQHDLKTALYQERHIHAWQDTQDFCHLFSEIYSHYHQYKVENGFLDFSDLIYKTIELLEDKRHMGWVFSQLDRKIHHILVDEAQDTSPAQWKVLELLSEVWNGQHNKTLFVVGDPKQSIYGFQGADLEQFYEAKNFFQSHAQCHEIPFDLLDLTHSFRSYSCILNVVNEVFQKDTCMDFKPHTALPYQQGGMVELLPILDSSVKKSSKILLAKLWVRRIRQWIEKKEILRCTGSVIKEDDILILMSKRCSLYETFSQELISQGFFVRETCTTVLKDTILVQDILALIYWLLNSYDDWSLVHVLKSPLFGISEKDLLSIFSFKSFGIKNLWTYLRSLQTEPWALYVKTLEHWKNFFFESTPFQFMQWWIYTPWVQKRYGAWPDTAQILDKVLALLFSFCQEQGKGWMQWIEMLSLVSLTFKQKTEKGIGVLTIHGSKGLQAPIVIIPDLSMEIRSKDYFTYTKDGPWKLNILQEDEDPWNLRHIEKQSQEERRILYVAMTRAQERLYCSSLKNSQPYQDVKNALSKLGKQIPWSLDSEINVTEPILRYEE
ncbi:ATP-dependent helicase/nuclease subunit A [Holospora elegans E1]|uniref:DNA 3'-5' helicase n=1 Tax=Holospora elegans E1 TaxID=1427503 RepID=A0A023DY46_9PROT|nr:UvrD-helicase domain-containing protein [Holospora elegans]GAJ46386.1 ATP-dependent helicase/nuclease subunit A [Holospora elegans E1]